MAYQAYNPGVTFFIDFYKLDPSSNNQCIYYTLKGTRCRWQCSDNWQAITLRETIIAASDEDVSLDLLQKYILSNCCMSGNAEHRRRMEKSGLLISLAQRWQDEIRRHAAGRFNPTTSVSTFGRPATPTSRHTTRNYVPTDNPLHHQANTPPPSSIGGTPSRPIVNSSSHQYSSPAYQNGSPPYQNSSPSYQHGSPIPSVPELENRNSVPHAYTTPVTPTRSHTTSRYGPYPREADTTPSSTASSSSYRYSSPTTSTAIEIASQHLGSQPHHDLSPQEANISANSTSVRPTSISQAPLSGSRERVPKSFCSQSISRKFLDALEEQDLQTGSLYIFDRNSFPSHVKIGWTTNSVQGRLEEWSKCGYKPNLLFEVNRVPHAQRVKTLTHHELIVELRVEKCTRCETPYHEWFKISRERAKHVVGNWADFMTKAEPYDSEGLLKNRWRKVIELMEGNGEMVTGKKLLDHYQASLFEEATIVREPLAKSEPVREDVSARETTPVKEELLAEREPLPPLARPFSTLHQNIFSSQETKQNPITGAKEAGATHITTNSDTNITVVDTSSNLGITSTSGRASSLATPREGNPQTNTNTSTDTNNTTNFLPPNFSRGPSKRNPPDLCASSRRKVESPPDPRAPYVMDIMKVLLSLSIDELEETKKTLASIMQRRQNVERGRQVEPESKLLEYDGQKREEVKSHDEDENTATEDEAGTGADGWDSDDETLEGDQIQRSLEKATVKIADSLPGKAKGVLNGLGGPKVSESEVLPAVEVAAQA